MKGNNTLPSLWDGLSLPKLIKGEVKVKDLEEKR